jgi:hypothetical protein
MAWNADADNNRVANPVADTGRYVFFSWGDPYSKPAMRKLRNDISHLSNIVAATVYSWTVGSAHFSMLQLTIERRGVFILCISKPYGDASPTRAWAVSHPADENLAAGLAALFGPRASLSVDRGDGRHFTCLRYPCARLTQESSAI